MKKFLLFGIVAVMGYGNISAGVLPATDADFDSWKVRFIEHMWEIYPAWASSVGYHKYDNLLIIPDEESRSHELGFCKQQLDSLHRFKIENLSPGNKIDYHLIENQLQYASWNISELKAWQWDASMYNVSGGVAEILAGNYQPLDQRLQSIKARLELIPAYYDAAKQNLVNMTAEHGLLAAEQTKGGMSVFSDELEAAIQKSGLSVEEKKEIHALSVQAVASMAEFAAWAEQFARASTHDFRLGEELYNRKFEFEIQSGYTAEEIVRIADVRKRDLHKKMTQLTLQLWPVHMKGITMPQDYLSATRMLIDKLSEDHVAPGDFQSAIEKQIPYLVKFIEKKNLLYLDPSKPLVVRKEPAYMAGVAGASINAPGPYDKNGNTYYNVGSLDGWEKEKAESYLREYNKYILQILNIHEAIPGHYTQLVYANKVPDIVKSVLGNNAMIEGWAVYTELMMLENGYDGDKGVNSKEASPEMWLMYYKWNLRSVCNTILDYSVHVKGMTENEAIGFLTREAFQQEAEARGKWRRVSVTQVQLCCYFTGFTEICNLRDEMKRKQGKAFDLKKFHEQFLSYGSAPVKYIREMMLGK